MDLRAHFSPNGETIRATFEGEKLLMSEFFKPGTSHWKRFSIDTFGRVYDTVAEMIANKDSAIMPKLIYYRSKPGVKWKEVTGRIYE